MRFIRRVFAGLVSIGLFLAIAWFFAVFLNPQGQGGWVAALIFIGIAAISSILLFAWLAKPGRPIRLDKGLDEDGGSIGLGLTGASVADRRRRDDIEPDNLGGRRKDYDGDEVTDGDFSEIT